MPQTAANIGSAPPPVPVPIRLVAGEAVERPELWVISEAGGELLRAFAATTDQRIIDQLDVAVPSPEVAVLRISPRKKGPTVLGVEAVPYVRYLRLPNLFIPAASRLRPPLRRDALRERFASADRIVWFRRSAAGIQVESVAERLFLPLADWLEYQAPLGRPHRAYTPALVAFALEPFTVREDSAPRTRKERAASDPVDVSVTPIQGPDRKVVKGTAPVRPAATTAPPPIDEAECEPLRPAEAVLRLRKAEGEFLAIDGPLDDPARLALWPRLADLSLAAGQPDDAAICWGNALWDHPSPKAVRRWAKSETRTLRQIDAALAETEPRLADARAVTAWVAGAATVDRPPADVATRLPAISSMLEANEHRLPVRLAWLAWVAVYRLSGNDLLALTRARDRLLADLFENGLRRERDFPLFLRIGTVQDPTVARIDSDRLLKLRDRVWDWCRGRSAHTGHLNAGNPVQRVLIDLTFAFALARFGDDANARSILADVAQPDTPNVGRRRHRPAVHEVGPYQRWLWGAYRERVERRLAGEPTSAPLSAPRRRELAALTPAERQTAERFLRTSRILEPFECVDPYRHGRSQDALGVALSQLAATVIPRQTKASVPEQLESAFADLFRKNGDPASMVRVLAVAVPMAVRIGEAFASDCLNRLTSAMAGLGRWQDARNLIDRVELLEAGLSVAAHFGRTPLVEAVLGRIVELVRSVRGEPAAWATAALTPGFFRFLARVGLAKDAKALLEQLIDAVTDGTSIGKLLARPGLNRGVVYPALTRLAAGLFHGHQLADARRAMAAVRSELLDGSMSPEPRTQLAAAYATALGHAPVPEALAGFTELLDRLPTNSTTMVADTIQRLRVVEAVALAISAEDFAGTAKTRTWLDEDEFLVRRRIHRDVEAAMRGAG